MNIKEMCQALKNSDDLFRDVDPSNVSAQERIISTEAAMRRAAEILPEMLAFLRTVVLSGSADGRWLDCDGVAIDGYDRFTKPPDEGALWIEYTADEQAACLAGLAAQAEALIKKVGP